ncbi:MAG: hypothetical protein AAFX79_09100 [Planctomycetota bacterium]
MRAAAMDGAPGRRRLGAWSVSAAVLAGLAAAACSLALGGSASGGGGGDAGEATPGAATHRVAPAAQRWVAESSRPAGGVVCGI